MREFGSVPALGFAEGPATGPPLLLLHGVTRGWRDWEPILPELTRHWRVLALDLRGHGGSGRAERYLVTDYAADVVRFVREEVGAGAVLYGHSLGAMVAAAVAAELPQLVRGVVLEDPPFHTMGERIHGTGWQAQFAGMREVAQRGGTVEGLTDALAGIRLPAAGGGFKRLGELRSRESLRWSAECFTRLDPEVFTPIIAGRWLDGYDIAEVFTRIRCPVLLLQADPAVGGTLSDADVELARRTIHACQCVRFPGTGHQLHRDQPAAVLRAVQEFLAQLPLNSEASRNCES